MDHSHYKHLLIDIDDGLAKVTINRPDARNKAGDPVAGHVQPPDGPGMKCC